MTDHILDVLDIALCGVRLNQADGIVFLQLLQSLIFFMKYHKITIF